MGVEEKVVVECDCCGRASESYVRYSDAVTDLFGKGWEMVGFGNRTDCWWCKDCYDSGNKPPMGKLQSALALNPKTRSR